MPIREYECDVCGRRFEKIQGFSDPPIEVCPTCGGHVHKMISSPAFQFKGSGWYVTDYARKDSGGKSDSDSGEKTAAKDSKDSKDAKDSKDPKESKETTSSDKESGAKKTESTTPSTTTEKSKNSSET
jgi:putative FmdB family regulatory protein